ncbi:MAG: hypothetical protein ABWY54_07225 [Glaciihabitans sp.]
MSTDETPPGKGRRRRPAAPAAQNDPSLRPPECYGPLGRDIGGYSNLAFTLIRLEHTLYLDPDTLPEIDALIVANPKMFERLHWELGMYYGHVITHTFVRAEWEPPSGGSLPTVRIGRNLWVEVMPIAYRRLWGDDDSGPGTFSLAGNFAYIRRMADKHSR